MRSEYSCARSSATRICLRPAGICGGLPSSCRTSLQSCIGAGPWGLVAQPESASTAAAASRNLARTFIACCPRDRVSLFIDEYRLAREGALFQRQHAAAATKTDLEHIRDRRIEAGRARGGCRLQDLDGRSARRDAVAEPRR